MATVKPIRAIYTLAILVPGGLLLVLGYTDLGLIALTLAVAWGCIELGDK